jgi:histone deacetylase 11
MPDKSFKPLGPHEGHALNQRVAIVYSADYDISLGGLEKLHPFDIHKYGKIYRQLMADGLLRPDDVFVPAWPKEQDLVRVHSQAYLDSLRDRAVVARCLEMPALKAAPQKVSDVAIVGPFRKAASGTVLAAEQAIRSGIAINLGGGYHHAKPDCGGGFNLYNDIAIAIRSLQARRLIQRALVVDLDVHQGNGTAVCLAGDQSVFTFDMHEADIYPIPKETNDLDVPLPAGTSDQQYLAILRRHLNDVIDQARPDLVIFQAGCDVLDGDQLGRLKLTVNGLIERDAAVIDACVDRAIPVAMVLGGGYGKSAWRAQYLSVRRTIQKYAPPKWRE